MSSSAGTGEARHPTNPSDYAAPDNLPVLRSPLVGREAELAAACSLLLRDDVGLLTFTGPGGVGKTRLALHLAAQLLTHFPQGVFFVNLAPLRDPSLVVPTIAQTLGVQEIPGHELIAHLREYLRGRDMLLVLDNFEQVVEAALDVGDLLSSCPRLKVLATSREVLHLSAEQVFPVPPLTCPATERLPSVEQITGYEAVRLFLHRARAVQPDFKVTLESARAVAAICLRVDGLPLAIELAASRVRLLTPEAILSRFEHRLPLLTGGPRDLPARQQTLRNTIDWSYHLLDDSEQQLFRRLALFMGGHTLQAVEAVCNPGRDLGGNALGAVSSLVDKSLLRKQTGVGSEPRFVLLDTIHEYAAEKLLESGETEELSSRHALYFMALAEEAEHRLRGAGQAFWLDRLEEEHDNMRAALAWSRGRDRGGQDARRLEIGLRIGGALQAFWDTRGHFTEGRAQLAPLLARSASLPPTASRAKALVTAALIAWSQADLAQARSLYEQSLSIYRPLGDSAGMTYALNGLANTVKLYGDYAAAASFLEQSLALARDLGDTQRIGAVLENLGEIVLAQGHHARAREIHEEGLRLFREVNDKLGIGYSLQDLGIVLIRQGDYHQARELLEEALAVFQEIGDKRFSGVALYELGQVARAQGDDVRAADLYRGCLTAAHSLSDRIFVGLGLGGLAAVAAGEGRPLRAARLFGASDAILEVTGYGWFQADLATFSRNKAATHASLGEERWQAAVTEGRAFSVEEAVAYALEPGPEPAHAPAADAVVDHPSAPALQQLTQREIEVLRLVARGLTAPQVATRMYLSVRTVENHLRSIYGKLNVSTRAAATRIAVEHGLLKE